MDKLFLLLTNPIEPTPRIRCENFPPACITDVSILANLVLPLVYLVAALLALALFIFGAFRYIKAQGEPERLKQAQQTITFAVLGLIIIFVAFFLVRIITHVLGIEFLL